MNNQEKIKVLEKLVSFRTFSNNSQEINRCLEFINEFVLKNTKLKGKKFIQNEHLSMIWRKRNSASISLIGHIDVVNAEVNMFKLEIKNNKIFGRGVLDMKGPVLSMIFAFISLINKGLSVELVLTSDEEIGGHDGIMALIKHRIINPRIAIIPDGLAGFNIIKAQKGPIHIFIQSKGKSAHASRPWEGLNSADSLIKCASKIKNKFNLAKKKNDWLSSASLTQIKVESAINQIPSKGEICLDLRITEKEKDWFQKIKNICRRSNCVIQRLNGDGKVFNLLRDKKKIHLWKNISKEVTKKNCREVITCGASDARHLSAETLSLITSVDGGGGHSEKEWIESDSIDKLQTIIEKFICKLIINV